MATKKEGVGVDSPMNKILRHQLLGGAQEERNEMRAYLNRLSKKGIQTVAIATVRNWLNKRPKRYNAKDGGFQSKKKK